jgi:hypothetical protein
MYSAYLASMPPTVIYWVLISPMTLGALIFGAVTVLLASVATFATLASRLYARALREGDLRGGRAGITLLILGPLFGSPLAVVLCSIAGAVLAFIEDVTGIPAGEANAVMAAVAAALVALVVVRQTRRQHAARLSRLRLLFVSGGAAALVTVGTVALLIVLALTNLQPSYSHLTSATYNGQRYHLAREDAVLEHSTLHLYQCDALGVLCQEVDSYGYNATVHSGLLQVDEYTDRVTARTPDGQLLFIYPLGDFFAQ